MKFKVGDKVRLRKGLRNHTRYAMENSPVVDSYIDAGMRFDGTTTVKGFCGGKYILACNTGWNYTDEMLLPADDTRKIVVTTDGKETLARLYEDGKVVKKATAKCSPDDEFNFETGARIALSRLIPGEEQKCPEIPKYLTGKVACVKTREPEFFTVGKIYDVFNGCIKADNGFEYDYEELKLLNEEHPHMQDYTEYLRLVED